MTEAEALKSVFGTSDKSQIVGRVWIVRHILGKPLSWRRPKNGGDKLGVAEHLVVPTWVGVSLPDGRVGVNWRGFPPKKKTAR